MLDGQDCALLRASVVDGAGRVVHLAKQNVSFRVVSGPGRVQGSHNGDPHSHLPNDLSWYPAYHGLVRAVVAPKRVALPGVDADGLQRLCVLLVDAFVRSLPDD